MKLPSEFKACEGCPNLQALLWGQEIICSSLGHIIGGVVYCVFSKGGANEDNGRSGGQPDADSDSGGAPDVLVGET